jgi:hypothetical protein
MEAVSITIGVCSPLLAPGPWPLRCMFYVCTQYPDALSLLQPATKAVNNRGIFLRHELA